MAQLDPRPVLEACWGVVRSHCRSMLLLALSCALLGLSYAYGTRPEVDQFLARDAFRAQQIASAIGDTAYGLDLRYAVHATILEALMRGGMSDMEEPLGASWNRLLDKAAHLERVSRTPRVFDHTLTFVVMEDLGLVDFFKVSFRLFGYNIEGFFKTYLLLLGLGVAFFYIAFWSRPGILIAGNLLLFGLFLSMCLVDSTDWVSNGRFLPTLAIVPTFHLFVLVWAPPPRSIKAFLMAAAQALLLALVIFMRNSASWTILLLGAVILGIFAWYARAQWSRQASIGALVHNAISWPMIVVIGTFVLFNTYQSNRIHPAYYDLDETLPHHLVWHSLAYSLSFLPEIDTLIPKLNGVRGDGLPTYLENAYLEKTIGYVPPHLSEYNNSHVFPNLGKPKTYERVVEAAYFDFIGQHPIEFLKLTVVIKTRMIVDAFSAMFARILTDAKFWFLVSSLFLVITMLLARPIERRMLDEVQFGIVVAGAMVLAAALPCFAAYPAYLGDLFALVAALIAAGLVLLLWRGWQFGKSRVFERPKVLPS